MGATEFYARADGETAELAFAEAVERAREESGGRGYTGTIAEKSSFRLVRPRGGEAPGECAERHEREGTFGDKWGPAGCVHLGGPSYAFFGVASC